VENLFDINNFNVIQDKENFYFFRSLEPGDLEDLKNGVINDGNKYLKLRTDRERWEEKHEERIPRWTSESEISLDQMYHHIKYNYSLQTNCISLTSDANVARMYGEQFSQNYVMITVPKREMGTRVISAGPYMLSEIEKRIDEALYSSNISEDIRNVIDKIDRAEDEEGLKEILKTRFKGKESVFSKTPLMRNDRVYKNPTARISRFQTLSEKQNLYKNRVVAKLTVLEKNGVIKPLIKHTENNSYLIRTLGGAFSSEEQIYYGDIEGERVVDIQKEMLDIFGLLQQVRGVEEQKLQELQSQLIQFVKSGKKIEIPKDSNLQNLNPVREASSIDEMYELTGGRIEYGKAESIVNNIFYLAQSKLNARELLVILRDIIENNPVYDDIFKAIENNGFEIETSISTRKSNIGYKISNAVNFDLKENELDLVEKISALSNDELRQIIQSNGLVQTQNIISSEFSKVEEASKITRKRYYAEAIFSMYNWEKSGVEEFSDSERELLLQKIQEQDTIKLYKLLENSRIFGKDIPVYFMNLIAKSNIEEILNLNEQDFLKFLEDNKKELSANITRTKLIEFLELDKIEGTALHLRWHQQEAVENTKNLYKENKKFSTVVLPTSSGKTYVSLALMYEVMERLNNTKFNPNKEPILYLAPDNEILNQTKKAVINTLLPKEKTFGKSEETIFKEAGIEFKTYASLLNSKNRNGKYKFIVLDELHRTGGDKWEKALDKLIENQGENTYFLATTATPDNYDGRNMADDIALRHSKRFGYTEDEIEQGKHLAIDMDLIEGIKLGVIDNFHTVSAITGAMEKAVNAVTDEERAQAIDEWEDQRRNLQKAVGIDKILTQNLKPGDKCMVFVPVNFLSNDELNEDDPATVQKIEAFKSQLKEWLKDSNLDGHYYSMLGCYSDSKNQSELDAFEKNTDGTSFMLVINKGTIGLHVEGVNKVIIARALDDNSKNLLLQIMGRAMNASDPENPKKEEDWSTIIDLSGNLRILEQIQNDVNNNTRKDDLLILKDIIAWMRLENGNVYPSIEGKTQQEKKMAAQLYKIYDRYINFNSELELENQEEERKQYIEQILTLGEEIDLWESELEPISQEIIQKVSRTGIFEVSGVLKQFVEIYENEVKRKCLKNALEIEKWCKENFEDKPKWEKKLPSRNEKDAYENSLGIKLNTIRRDVLKKYKGKKLEEIENKEDRRIAEIIEELDREYGLGPSLKNALKIENWCKENFGDKPKWERKLPNSKSKDKYENNLGTKLVYIRNNILIKYKGKKLEEIKDEEDRRIVEIVKDLDEEYGLGDSLKNALEIENWCKENFGDKPKWERKLPCRTKRDKYENSLGGKLSNIRQNILKKYEGKKLEEIKDEEDRRIVEIVKDLDEEYGLGDSLKNALEIENWCKENFGDKPIWERKLPCKTEKDKYENNLGGKLGRIREKVEEYKGKKLEEIENEEDRRIVEILARLDREYGLGDNLKNALKIENWCKENFGDKPKWERKLPSRNKKDAYENNLGIKLSNIRQNILRKYEGQKLEEIENEEDRRIVEIIRKLDREYNSRKIKAQEIGQATFTAGEQGTALCDEAHDVLSKVIKEQQQTKEGGTQK
jgi:hypothetical protein